MYGFVACLLVFLDISLSTIFTWRIYSYTPVDARYFPKGGAVVEVILFVIEFFGKILMGIPCPVTLPPFKFDQHTLVIMSKSPITCHGRSFFFIAHYK